MAHCYLCNKELIDKKVFDKLSDVEKKTKSPDHGEHIFQQAIGGTLSPKGILCSPCGNILAREIDTPFTKQFQNITSRLNFYRDRKIKQMPRSPDGIMEFKGKVLLVYMQGEDVYPVKLYDFEKEGTVYVILKKNTSNEYIESQVKKKYPDIDIQNFEIIRNLKGYGAVHVEHNLENGVFRQGFAKIAIGFAIHKGIKRKYLNLVLDLNKYRFKNSEDLQIVNYFPTTITEKCIEKFRFTTGNLESMFHQIKLFSCDNMLIAYIEIFGVYQVSLLLSDCYTGEDIYETYMQPLFKRRSDILKSIPDREDYQINYQHKLKPETKKQICFDLQDKELQDLLKLMNKDIQKFNTDEALNIDVDDYYRSLLCLYMNSYFLKDSESLMYSKRHLQYINIINSEIADLSEDSIMEQLLITKLFLDAPSNIKVITWNCNHTNNQLVFFQNREDFRKDRIELTNYLNCKFYQLSRFLELYVHQLLSEGQWELYASNGLQNSFN